MISYLEKTEYYLQNNLIPFWANRVVEKKYGGFQTNFDRNGIRTNVTEKSFLAQCRSLFTISHTVRSGYTWPNHEQALAQGIKFLFKYYQDKKYGGYYWIVNEDGSVLDDNKIIYGHAFLIYGLSEFALLTGDESVKTEAIRVFDFLQDKIKDQEYGGYFEHFNRQFEPIKARNDIGVFKSLDVHMHLMEAFTTLYELTGDEKHRLALEEINTLIINKMIHKETGTGISMFTQDWSPIANVELETVWGADRFDENGKSIDITSYGHNIELTWLYLLSQDVLKTPREKSWGKMVKIYEHTYQNGIDWINGGLFVEGEKKGSATETNKEFWQQAEGMVGFLDAYLMTDDEKYLDAFKNIHDFVFEKMINWEQGEWFALLDQKGNVIWDYMGTSWKTLYHTVRGMCEISNRLRKIIIELKNKSLDKVMA